jgi:hypothetical protein
VTAAAALERITIILPRMVGSNLREARVAAASAAAEGGVAMEAAIMAAMGTRGGASAFGGQQSRGWMNKRLHAVLT